MTINQKSASANQFGRVAALGLTAVHAIALLILYFVPAFVCPNLVAFCEMSGLPETPLLFRASLISDFVAGFTPIVFAVAVLYLFAIFRCARAGARWLPAISNVALVSVAFFGMVYTSWMVNPILVWVGNPIPFAAANPGVAMEVDAAPNLDGIIAHNDGHSPPSNN